jgi:hypothetical protein
VDDERDREHDRAGRSHRWGVRDVECEQAARHGAKQHRRHRDHPPAGFPARTARQAASGGKARERAGEHGRGQLQATPALDNWTP